MPPMLQIHQEFVKQGRVSLEHGMLFSQLFRLRQEGDYEDLLEIDLATVQGYIGAAEEFVECITALVMSKQSVQ